jgi:hypothetical protein
MNSLGLFQFLAELMCVSELVTYVCKHNTYLADSYDN